MDSGCSRFDRLLAFALVAVLAFVGLGSIFIRREPGQPLTVVLTNTPARWCLSSSPDLTNWTPYLRKESGEALRAIEIDLGTNAAQFWRLDALP